MKYNVDFTANFKKQYYNKAKRQGKDLNKLHDIINKLANGQDLESK